MKRFAVSLAALLAVPGIAAAAAWTAPKDELIVTQTTLVDLYSYYARNSTNARLLEEPQGSVAQAGDVRRFGFLLGLEYGLTEKVTANLNLAYFYTQHASVGANIAAFTNSQPNTAHGLQDFTGTVKYLAYQREGPVMVGIAPSIGWGVPTNAYDTSLNNPLGDGILYLDLGLNSSFVIPSARLFINADLIYRAREDKAVRVGHVWPEAVKQANPSLPISRTGGQIHDQVQGILEVGYFFTNRISVRGVVKRIESLGGENLTFEGMPEMMNMGLERMPMFENSLAYDQDATYVGVGPYFQVSDSFGIGATYVHAVWFRNFPNMKTFVLSFSYNPQFARKRAQARLHEQAALEAAAGEEYEELEEYEEVEEDEEGVVEEEAVVPAGGAR